MRGAPLPPRQEELQPHQVKDQLPSVSYCITIPPPWSEAVILGFQHYIVMLGTTVIIPSAIVLQMRGGNSFFRTRLLAVMGGSYTVVAPTISIILAGRYIQASCICALRLSHPLCDLLVKLIRFCYCCEEILADNARNTRCYRHRIDNTQIILGFSGL